MLRLFRSRSLLALGCVVVLASCSTSTAPPTSAQLSKRVLTAATLPAQFKLFDLQPSGSDESPAAKLTGAQQCSDLITGSAFMQSAPQPVGRSTAVVTGHFGILGSWNSTEALASYSGDGAKNVLAALRSLVQRCPTYSAPYLGASLLAKPLPGLPTTLEYQFSLVAGPKLGDESVTLQARVPSPENGAVTESDAIFIRVGNVLMVVGEHATFVRPSDPATPLNALAAAVYAAYTAGKS